MGTRSNDQSAIWVLTDIHMYELVLTQYPCIQPCTCTCTCRVARLSPYPLQIVHVQCADMPNGQTYIVVVFDGDGRRSVILTVDSAVLTVDTSVPMDDHDASVAIEREDTLVPREYASICRCLAPVTAPHGNEDGPTPSMILVTLTHKVIALDDRGHLVHCWPLPGCDRPPMDVQSLCTAEGLVYVVR